MWHNPWLDPRGAGYQLRQSLITIGSGGLWGVGLGKSRQKSLYLPEEHNDFIFAIVCEELGLVPDLAVGDFDTSGWNGWKNSERKRDGRRMSISRRRMRRTRILRSAPHSGQGFIPPMFWEPQGAGWIMSFPISI